MVIMDLKGITWVGHVYQKFEAMCLEAEDIMYQDTVKYVENQVQTVGASVKKFYSDVMQDILPPSSMELVKGGVALYLPAEQTTDTGICKKQKVGMNEEAIKVDNEQLTDYLLPTTAVDKDEGYGSSFQGFHFGDTSLQSDSVDTVRGECSDVDSKKCNKTSRHNQSSLCAPKISKEENLPCSDMDFKKCYNRSWQNKPILGSPKIFKEENLPSSETSGAINRMERDPSRASLSCELSDENQEASGDQVAVNPILAAIEVADHRSFEETYDELENEAKGTPGVLTNSSSSKNCNDIENSSACSSCSGLSIDLNEICTNNVVVSLGRSSMNENVQLSEFSDEIAFVFHPGRSDCLTIDPIESSIVVEQGFEAIQQADNIEVEEPCVLVNGDELHFVPCKERKHRPYKNKIRDAISSRMRSVRKHEYEELAVWYGQDVKSKQEFVEMKSSPSDGSCEFEWELL